MLQNSFSATFFIKNYLKNKQLHFFLFLGLRNGHEISNKIKHNFPNDVVSDDSRKLHKKCVFPT